MARSEDKDSAECLEGILRAQAIKNAELFATPSDKQTRGRCVRVLLCAYVRLGLVKCAQSTWASLFFNVVSLFFKI